MATFRRMTAETLIQGWWGYTSWLIGPITVIINLVRRSAVADLPPPSGQYRQPLNPEPGLLSRPSAIGGLVIAGVFVLIVILAVVVMLLPTPNG